MKTEDFYKIYTVICTEGFYQVIKEVKYGQYSNFYKEIAWCI